MSLPLSADTDLAAVAAELKRLDPDGSRTAQVLRDTLDQLYDGQRTGRYRWNQLFKTEKTHCGTLVEINLHREFKFADGERLDYRIAEVEVDCKYSQKMGGWMIPPEARGHLCLLIWAEDSALPVWSLGLVRITEDLLNTGGNRDAKATLNKVGRQAIAWLFKNQSLPPNVLLQLEPSAAERIFAQTRSGRKRVNELFRVAIGRTVGRAAVATVARQDDYMKRVRENGGARTDLKPEGIIILGQYAAHAKIARALGAPVPGPGESVSIRVIPAGSSDPGTAQIDGGLWRMAKPGELVTHPAPRLPKIKKATA